MQVKIINKPENVVDTLYKAVRTCYSSVGPIDIDIDIPTQNKIDLITKVLQSSHTSVVEHINFTFGIQDISRACLTQLTRHRIASYSVKSQRYVEIKEGKHYIQTLINFDREKEHQLEIINLTKKYFVLDWVKEEDLLFVCCRILENIVSYLEMIEHGYRPEDARMFLPNAFKTDLTMTINLRSLMNLCNERLCTRAQKEIRQLTSYMVKEICKDNPWLSQFLVPKCEKLKYCPERNSCGRKKSINEVLNV